jgi:hypothetical protein
LSLITWAFQDVPAALKSLFKTGSVTPPQPLDDGTYGSPVSNPVVLREMAQSAEYYRGNAKKAFVVRAGSPDDNVSVNHAAIVVDVGVAFLLGTDVGFEVDRSTKGKTAGDPTQDSALLDSIDQYLADVFENNRKMSLLTAAAINGGIKGHSYIKIVPQAGKKYPKLIPLDPSLVTPIAKPDDVSEITAYVIEFSTSESGKPVQHREVHSDNFDGTWKIVVSHKGERDRDWTIDSELTWPYPFAAIVSCQNRINPNMILGISDIDASIRHIIDLINRNTANVNKILRFHAHPRTYARGLGGVKLGEWNPSTILELQGDEAEIKNIEMQSDLGSSMAMIKHLEDELYTCARIPPIAMARFTNLGSLSGVALSILYRPLVEKTEQKRLTYGDMFTDLCLRLLVLAGKIESTDDLNIKIVWTDLIPLVLADALGLQELGVSKSTLLSQFGYDAEAEAEKVKAEAPATPQLPPAPTAPPTDPMARPAMPPIKEAPAMPPMNLGSK